MTIDGAQFCLSETTKRKADLVKGFQNQPFNIRLDKCDILPMILMTCFIVEAEIVSKSFSLKLLALFKKLIFMICRTVPRNTKLKVMIAHLMNNFMQNVWHLMTFLRKLWK